MKDEKYDNTKNLMSVALVAVLFLTINDVRGLGSKSKTSEAKFNTLGFLGLAAGAVATMLVIGNLWKKHYLNANISDGRKEFFERLEDQLSKDKGVDGEFSGFDCISKYWIDAQKNSSSSEEAESDECMAESCRVLASKILSKYSNRHVINISDSEEKHFKECAQYYEYASEKYKKRNKYSTDMAKSYETKAKSLETMIILNSVYGNSLENENLMIELENCWVECGKSKVSYDLYSKARLARFLAVHQIFSSTKNTLLEEKLWQDASDSWKKLKNDKKLITSFGGQNGPYWIAFLAYIDANVEECLFKAGKSTKEEVSSKWHKTAERDYDIVEIQKRKGIADYHFMALAAEAYCRSKIDCPYTLI
ncbi:MAG: hypothetical protein LBK29_03760 [Oscillospiraceae bacterium]|jgi:hypothetical protein|nr:hypothetical protein [Oscillospiraceae bacterium]